ncbi:hypothetical protein EDC39_10554 [Geothermobacter ehrlichii]|uniref:Uncharacterized protein n=1 Tax=Geothermobacter ehrlichii TaxID=213224 RepID=A0A5D3WID6_9BACT|nr:hypothetical protein [Geothermobacter ehrlichii]TYO98692.1 hypothetical protein EDC39_10554 [Geothermobacter ehrlichii]
MDFQVMLDQALALWQRWPLPVAVGGGLLLLLFFFRRKLLFQLLGLLLFVAGVFLIVQYLGKGLDTGIDAKKSMIHKTEKALE